MTEKPVDLSVVIVNWNTRQLLLDCLEAVGPACGPLRVECFVVDNGSSDGSPDAVASRFPAVRLIRNRENAGFARANNQAIAVSRGRHVLLLNSDTVPLPGSLAALTGFVDAHPDVGVAGPKLLNGDGTLQPSWAAFPSLGSELRGVNRLVRRPYTTRDGSLAYEADWVSGACLLIRREVIEVIGPLDERYFMYTEETDWCFRARRAGWVVCHVPVAEVVHLGGQSSRQASPQMKGELYRSKLLFFRTHRTPLEAGAFALAVQARFRAGGLAGRLLTVLTAGRSGAGRWLSTDSREVLRAVGRPVGEPRQDSNLGAAGRSGTRTET